MGLHDVETKVATIAASESLSDSVDLGSGTVFGIIIPASWTTADLTFQGSVDGTNFYNLFTDDGTEYTVVAAASRFIASINYPLYYNLAFLKVRSGTAGSPVNQAAERQIKLVMR